MSLRYVITDIDGTIVDRMPIYGNIFSALLDSYGMSEESAKEYYFSTAGTPIPIQFRSAIQQTGRVASDEAVNELVRRFFECAKQVQAPLFPGAREVLEEAKALGLALCATSGSDTKELNEIFEREGLPYDIVLGSDAIKKGDAHIVYFARHFGIPMHEFSSVALYLGDGPTDMEIAKRNGILAVGITTTVDRVKLIRAGAHMLVDNLDEFGKLLKSLV